jgi:hypothetical protein
MAIIEPIEQSPYPEPKAASAMAPPAARRTTRVVTGIFETRAAASGAVDSLIQYGRSREDISMMMSSGTRTKEFGFETHTHAAESAGIGSAVGGAAGAILAAIAAVGTNVVLPGLGLIVAGPLAAAFAGAGAGGAAGGLIGALIGAGVPEHRATIVDTGLRKGGILLGVEVHSNDEAKVVEMLLKQHGATGVTQE